MNERLPASYWQRMLERFRRETTGGAWSRGHYHLGCADTKAVERTLVRLARKEAQR